MDPSGSYASGSNGPQKRVLPSRTRRGGPGVGSCDADLLILEHQRRKFETDALIHPNTPFILSTNSKQFTSSNDSIEISLVPSQRYFDRPDVLEAFRNKQTLPTPEWNEVGVPDVGRFRPRGPEDTQIDTSDAAYERRHKKYENFEKRQRLREKEKLKHEQYKLKERIEQLRIMDASAFLALPASNFPHVPGDQEDEIDTGVPFGHVNGTAAYHEGERRRKAMLDIALTLEARFRVLLPPEKIRKPQTQRSTRENTIASPTTTHTQLQRAASDTETSEREEEIIDVDDHDQRRDSLKIKLKLSDKGSASQSPAPTSISRSSKRSGTTNAPSTKKYQRRKSRPIVNTYPSLELPSSLQVQVEERLREQDELGLVSEEEFVPVPSDDRTTAVIPQRQQQYSDLLQLSTIHLDGTNPGLSIPPRDQVEQVSISNTRPEPALENATTLLEHEHLPVEVSEYLPHREDIPAVSSPHIDVETLQEPSPYLYPPPPPIETLRIIPFSHPKSTKPNASPRRRPGRARKATDDYSKQIPEDSSKDMTEDHSKLLDLANAAASSASERPSKRTKTRHSASLSKSRESSHQPEQATEEQEPVFGSPRDSGFPLVTVQNPLFTNGTVTSPVRRSPSIGQAVPAISFIVPPIPISASPPEAVSSISEAASFRRARGISSGRKSNVEYQSRDTGALRRTDSLLLIASIRGSVRQTQRHQMAFGVKVPEEISTAYDFWLPDEYLPEEEMLKYNNYEP